MFEKGSTCVYGSRVCKIADIGEMTFGKVSRAYYTLSPVFDSKNVIYVPLDNEALTAKMKPLISREEILELIRNMPKSESLWYDDDRIRTAEYKEIIERGTRQDIIRIIKTLFEHKKEMVAKGKKLHSSDEIVLERAEKTVYEEFALVLGIEKEQVVPFILSHIENGV